jgi:hypothetical protein
MSMRWSSTPFWPLYASYQEHRQYDPAQRSAWIETIATNCGQAASLDAAGIDRLCQRLNTNTEESDDPV